jgi:SAM-dependent methyltransferase
VPETETTTPPAPAGGGAVAGITSAHVRQTYTPYPQWSGVIPWPPEALMYSVGAATLENFVVVADAWNQVIARWLRPGAQVLDIGCGCGRLARLFAVNPWVERYVGFDVVPESIEWCNRFVVPFTGPRFQFLHFDIHSEEYNRNGAIRAADFRFPAATGSTQLVVASSLFTHVLEDDARHYLAETRRVLAPDGVALLSIHTLGTPEHPYVGTETRIDVYPPYWCDLATAVGLVEREHLDDLCGQTVYVLGVRS